VDSARTGQRRHRKAFTEALKIYRELAQKKPGTYLPYVATTLNNLGTIDGAQNRLEAAPEGI
jgi:hypothetical protein